MPIEAVRTISWPAMLMGARNERRTCSASMASSRASDWLSRSSANWSPPTRPSVSCGPRLRPRRRAPVRGRHAGGLELEPAVGVVDVAHAELDSHLAARALLHRGKQQLEALAVGGVHVLGEVVDLGGKLARLEAQHRLHHRAHLDLVA